jgi:hypothetical protein
MLHPAAWRDYRGGGLAKTQARRRVSAHAPQRVMRLPGLPPASRVQSRSASQAKQMPWSLPGQAISSSLSQVSCLTVQPEAFGTRLQTPVPSRFRLHLLEQHCSVRRGALSSDGTAWLAACSTWSSHGRGFGSAKARAAVNFSGAGYASRGALAGISPSPACTRHKTGASVGLTHFSWGQGEGHGYERPICPALSPD